MSPSKPNCMKVKHPRETLFWGRKIRAHSEIWGVGITGLLGLLAGQTQGKRKLSCAFVMGGRFTLRARCPRRELELLPSHGDWQVGTPPFSIMSFQRVGPRSLRNTVLGIKLARGFKKKFAFQRGKKRPYNYRFF